MSQRLPIAGSDDGTWGDILNGFLSVSLASDGTLNSNVVADTQVVASAAINPTKIAGTAEVQTNKGAASGYASLNSSGVVPTAELGAGTASTATYLRGDSTWVAIGGGGSGTLASDTDVTIVSPTNGQVLTYNTGASKWENSNPAVASVFGRTGAVTAQGGDYTAAQVTGALVNTNNLSDVSSVSTARTNLGLGTAATQATGTFLQVSNNLSDLASANTARTNLGLGTAATENVGTGAGTVMAGNQAAGGDLTGTYPNPTVSSTANFKTQVETVRLDQMAAPAAAVSLNSQKITNLANGTASTDAAAFGQIPTTFITSGLASGLAAWLATAAVGAAYIATDTGALYISTASDTAASFGVTTLPIVAWSASNGVSTLAYAVANLWTITGVATATIPNAAAAGTSTEGPMLVLMNAVGSTANLTLSDPTTTASLTGTVLAPGQTLILTTAGTSWQTYATGPTGLTAGSANIVIGGTLFAPTIDVSSTAKTDLGLANTALQAANNLSDLANAGSARANLHIPVLTLAAAVAVANVTSLSTSTTTIDGYSLASGDQVLLTAQSTASQNGLWSVPASGAWTRPTEFPSAGTVKGRTCTVINGTVYANTSWVLDAPTAGITIDTSSQTWVQGTNTQYSTATVTAAEIEGTFTAQGNLYLGTGSGTGEQLAVGAAGTVLGSNGTQAAWVGGNASVAVVSQAATVGTTAHATLVTNNAASSVTITVSTSGAVAQQSLIVQFLDFSAVAQTLAWTNTENSTVSVPTTSNGSTTLPLTVGFIWNTATSKWRCVAAA